MSNGSEAREEDLAWIRLVRRHDLMEHRMSELCGMLQGRKLSARRDGGLRYVARWIEEHEELWERWPVSAMRGMLSHALDPEWRGTDAEVAEVEAALERYTPTLVDEVHSWSLVPLAPYDEKAHIEFEGRRMVFSGVFVGCTKWHAKEWSRVMGAQVRQDVARVTDVLVVGGRCHPGWKQSRYGRKIAQVVAWRKSEETRCRIVREQQWTEALVAEAARHRQRLAREDGGETMAGEEQR